MIMQHYPFLRSFGIGCVSGLSSLLIIYPLDMAKSQLQFSGNAHGTLYRIFKSIYKEHGFTSLYRGMTPLMISTMVRFGLQFSVFKEMNNRLSETYGRGDGISFLSGMSSGLLIGVFVSTPSNRIKSHQIHTQNQRGIHHYGSLRATMDIWSSEGSRGFFRGCSAAVLKDSLSIGFKFAMYQRISDTVGSSMGSFGHALAGGIAGTASCVINNPLDVCLTRMQTTEKLGLLETAAKIWKEEGSKSFMRGSMTRVMRTIPGNTILFGIYNFLDQHWAK